MMRSPVSLSSIRHYIFWTYVNRNNSSMEHSAALPERIDHFVRQCDWWLQRSDVTVVTREYPNLSAAQSSAAAAELQRAAALLKEALREWQREKEAHIRTKELLRLAMLELRGSQFDAPLHDHPSPAAEVLASRTPQQQRSLHRQSQNHRDHDLMDNAAEDSASVTSPRSAAVMHHMLRGALTAANATMGVNTLSSDAAAASPLRIVSPHVTSLRSPRRQGGAQSPPLGTSPFRSAVPRFRDTVGSGDHLFLPTKASRSVGVEYKTNADVERLLSGGVALSRPLLNHPEAVSSSSNLTPAALRARVAVQQLHRRLMGANDSDYASDPRKRAGATTLYSPV